VQQGLDPNDWKSFSNAGLGVREIRVKDPDVQLAQKRFRELIQERKT